MKRKRFSEEQIIEILRLHRRGRSLPICAGSTGSARQRCTTGGADMVGCRYPTPSGCGRWRKRTAS